MSHHRSLQRVHWLHVPDESKPSWASLDTYLFAIWPAPINDDLCFQQAGFVDFADTDATWDEEFATCVQRLIEQLRRIGQPHIRQRIEFARSSFTKRSHHPKRPSLLDQLLAPTVNDAFPPCSIEFGNPAIATLRTSDGHAILWLLVNDIQAVDVSTLVRVVADDRPVVQTALAWNCLFVPHS